MAPIRAASRHGEEPSRRKVVASTDGLAVAMPAVIRELVDQRAQVPPVWAVLSLFRPLVLDSPVVAQRVSPAVPVAA